MNHKRDKKNGKIMIAGSKKNETQP